MGDNNFPVSQINQQIANCSSAMLLRQRITFFLSYSKYLLYKIRDIKSDGYTDHKFISASIMLGMWQKMQPSPEIENFNSLKFVEARFS